MKLPAAALHPMSSRAAATPRRRNAAGAFSSSAGGPSPAWNLSRGGSADAPGAFIAALLLAAAPAAACDLGGSYAEAWKAEEGAEVYVQNNLAPGPLASRCTIFVRNVGSIVIGYIHRPGNEPDSVYLVVPPGFAAIPPEAVLEEGAAARFKVVPELLG